MNKILESGSKIKVTPTPRTLIQSYPAANWVKSWVAVVLLEDCPLGSLDVVDVETDDHKVRSVYGFNIVG